LLANFYKAKILIELGCYNLGAEDEGVATVEGDSWLDEDGNRRVRHMISGESPYLACQLSVF
jgi:hypothetical protein